MNETILKEAARRYGTPCYIFDRDVFCRRAEKVKEAFGGGVGLCFSIKADPFLLEKLPETFSYIEVCSPGELSICRKTGIAPERIIFSGVNKTVADMERAIDYGCGIFTAESLRQVTDLDTCAGKKNKRIRVILRLSHGSQFGMDRKDLLSVIEHREEYAALDIIGLHYFTGTQKTKARTIEKELTLLDELCQELREQYGFVPSHIEYGTGLGVEYYKDFTQATDLALLEEAAVPVRAFGEKYPLTVEMGRFFAADCGTYLTSVMDVKNNDGITYVICDGGINQLNYYGQNMAMKVPPVHVLGKEGGTEGYCLCGSLCTTADVLVRQAILPDPEPGDIITFGKCGAYSVSEGIAAFLSRAMPAVAMYSEEDGLTLLRPLTETWPLNAPRNGGEGL